MNGENSQALFDEVQAEVVAVAGGVDLLVLITAHAALAVLLFDNTGAFAVTVTPHTMGQANGLPIDFTEAPTVVPPATQVRIVLVAPGPLTRYVVSTVLNPSLVRAHAVAK